eukprot:1157652-Pelagomonas_calceolata.AAC.3
MIFLRSIGRASRCSRADEMGLTLSALSTHCRSMTGLVVKTCGRKHEKCSVEPDCTGSWEHSVHLCPGSAKFAQSLSPQALWALSSPKADTFPQPTETSLAAHLAATHICQACWRWQHTSSTSRQSETPGEACQTSA